MQVIKIISLSLLTIGIASAFAQTNNCPPCNCASTTGGNTTNTLNTVPNPTNTISPRNSNVGTTPNNAPTNVTNPAVVAPNTHY